MLRRDIIILDKWLSGNEKHVNTLLSEEWYHRMVYVHLPVENLDIKRSAKREITMKGCMAAHAK